MEEKKWAGDLDTVKSEVVRFCPKCSKQSYHTSLNRHGVVLSAKCVLCGYNLQKEIPQIYHVIR